MNRVGGKLCAIHQPNLFPRLSTLAKLFAADIWIALDDVQFARRDYQHRARLGRRDDEQWMSLSVSLPDGRSTLIKDVRMLERERSARRILRMTRQHHGRDQHWPSVDTSVSQVAEVITSTETLADVAMASTVSLLELLRWPGLVVRSSEFAVDTDRSTRLAELTFAVGASEYLCGRGGAGYLQSDPFDERGLGVRYFSVPAEDSEVWAGANRLSSISALTTVGVAAVQRAFEQETQFNERLPVSA